MNDHDITRSESASVCNIIVCVCVCVSCVSHIQLLCLARPVSSNVPTRICAYRRAGCVTVRATAWTGRTSQATRNVSDVLLVNGWSSSYSACCTPRYRMSLGQCYSGPHCPALPCLRYVMWYYGHLACIEQVIWIARMSWPPGIRPAAAEAVIILPW